MEEGKKKSKKADGLSASFTTGAIALVFLILGYQVALFVHKAAVTRMAANRDHPDTVYVIDRTLAEEILLAEKPVLNAQDDGPIVVRKQSNHAPEVRAVLEKAAPRPVESFRFNPNTATLEDLIRLGFSEKQAQSILHYREAGGRFRRPSDFAKSFVVADSVYQRLEPYIDIPLLDINTADSLALLELPGIGPFFAGKIVQYRQQLGGYSKPEQLMEIWHFDREKYDGLKDLITCSEPAGFALWSLPEADLALHPHISKAEAHGIVLFREHHRAEDCTLEALRQAGVLSEDHFTALSRCRLAPPPTE